jgi:cobalt-zinc-cadmium efflux system outer membrane protein
LPDSAPDYRLKETVLDQDMKQFAAEHEIKIDDPQTANLESLTPETMRRLALSNNSTVELARLKTQKAKHHLAAASAWPNPELDGRVLVDENNSISSEAAFRFTLPLGGRVSAAAQAAAHEFDLSRLELEIARQETLQKLDNLLALLAHARARLDLFTDLSARSKQYAELARSRLDATMADPLDVALINADAADDRRAVQKEQAEVKTIEQKIRLLLGLPPNQGVIQTKLLDRLRLVDSKDRLASLSIENNYAVLEAKLKLMIAESGAAKVAATRVPDLQLGPAITTENKDVALGISLGVPIPVFQSGRSQYQKALAQRSMAQEFYQQEIRNSVAKVHTLLNQLDACQAELEQLLGDVHQSLKKAVAMAEVRYAAGKLDALKLLLVHRAFSKMQLEIFRLLLNQHQIIFDLQKVVGRPLETEEVKL